MLCEGRDPGRGWGVLPHLETVRERRTERRCETWNMIYEGEVSCCVCVCVCWVGVGV